MNESCSIETVTIPGHIENIGDEEVLTLTEVASLVGFTTRTIKNWIDSGLLCAYKFGVPAGDELEDDSNASLRVYGMDLKEFFRNAQIVPKRFKGIRGRMKPQ